MPWPKAAKLPMQFDGAALRREMQRLEDTEWVRHFNMRDYRGEWDVVSLRSTTGVASNIYSTPTPIEYRDTELLARSEVFQEVLAAFACPLRSVRLMRLGAGSEILEHADTCLSFEDGEVRVHIPVRTNPLVEFYLDGARIRMNEGEAWYLNFNLKHSVANRGAEDRIHLVVDCTVNDWIRRMAGVPAVTSAP